MGGAWGRTWDSSYYVGFFLLCALAGLLFLPCLRPCFIPLISAVTEGMQLTTMPVNPKLATSRQKPPPNNGDKT